MRQGVHRRSPRLPRPGDPARSGVERCACRRRGGDQFRWTIRRGRAVGDVEERQSSVSPGGVGGISGDDRVVQRVAPTLGVRVGCSPPAVCMPSSRKRPTSTGLAAGRPGQSSAVRSRCSHRAVGRHTPSVPLGTTCGVPPLPRPEGSRFVVARRGAKCRRPPGPRTSCVAGRPVCYRASRHSTRTRRGTAPHRSLAWPTSRRSSAVCRWMFQVFVGAASKCVARTSRGSLTSRTESPPE